MGFARFKGRNLEVRAWAISTKVPPDVRIAGIGLLLIGLVIGVAFTFMGCNALFQWNGRHAIASYELPAADPAADTPHTTKQIQPEPGRRYTLSVQVVFDREGLPRKEGVMVATAKMPLVVQVKDAHGTSLAQAVGFLDPNEPPNVLYGGAAHESMRGPIQELMVERLIGPFTVASAEPITVDIGLGADRLGASNIVARRLVVHDDTLPPTIKNAFILAGVGSVLFLGGFVLLVASWFRRKPKKKPL